jgi:tetratricopeptide (TPR) repeat protein
MALSAIQSLSAATVRIVDADGGHAGHGLGIILEDGSQLVLTCQHVLARSPDLGQIPMDVFGPNDEPLGRVFARYEKQRSDPKLDLAVLIPHQALDLPRLTFARIGEGYNSRVPVVGVTRLTDDSQRLEATLSAPSRLALKVPLFTGVIPLAFRLTQSTDTRSGISGVPVIISEGHSAVVLGLIHFSRPETVSIAREAYVIPITAWFPQNRELKSLSRPFVDPLLAEKAIVKVAADLDPFADFGLLGYRDDQRLERPEEALAGNLLHTSRRCLVTGRPASGKTWIAYRAAGRRSGLIVIPQTNYPPESFDKSALFDGGLLLLIDGLERFDSGFSFADWYRALNQGSLAPSLLVTCRDGLDWQNVKRRFPALYTIFEQNFARRRVFTSTTPDGGSDLDPETAKAFIERAGLAPAVFGRFDGTIGSLVAPSPVAMADRYESLREASYDDAVGTLLLDSLKVLVLLHHPLSEANAKIVASLALNRQPSDALWRWLKRLTEQSGFGRFDDRGFFHGYRVYLERCVTYVPSPEDFYQFVEGLKDEADEAPLVTAGIALLREYDPRGMEFLSAAINKGSKAAVLASLAHMGEVPQLLLPAIRFAHSLVRGGQTEFLAVLAYLYDARGKRSLAIRAYRAAVEAGDKHAKGPLGCLLLENPATAPEGTAYLRQAVEDDPAAPWGDHLAIALLDEIGSERQVEALLKKEADSDTNPVARLLLGMLYSVWPGHLQQAEVLLEAIIRTADSDFSRILGYLAADALQQIASLHGDVEAMKLWSTERARLKASKPTASPVLRHYNSPMLFRDEGKPGIAQAPPSDALSLSFAKWKLKISVPDMRRFEILSNGWRDVWTPDDSRMATVVEKISKFHEAGYIQAGLVVAVGDCRKGRFNDGLRTLRAALAEWNQPDGLRTSGKLLEISVLTDCGQVGGVPELLQALVDIVPADVTDKAGQVRDLAAAAAAELRDYEQPDANAVPFAATVHHCLSVLWMAIEQPGPAWYERSKALELAGEEAFWSFQEALDPPAYDPADDVRQFEELAENLRSGAREVLRIAQYRGMFLELTRDGTRLLLVGEWPELWGDGLEKTFLETALALSNRLIKAEWRPSGHRFHTAVSLPADRLTGPVLARLIGSLVFRLEEIRKLVSSGAMMIRFEAFPSGINFEFGRPTPGETLKHWQQKAEQADTSPLLKAEAHWQVGDNYLQLEEGSRQENIAAAIDAYRRSLASIRKSQHQWEWGHTQEKLGRAYLEMTNFKPAFATQAAHCLDAALSVYKRTVDQFRWAVLMVLRTRAAHLSPPRMQMMNVALEKCQAALSCFDRGRDPLDWAWAQEELGLAHLARARELIMSGQPGAGHIASAQACFEAALTVYFRGAYAWKWAVLHSELADCELLDASRDRREAIPRAIAALNASLEIFSESAYPYDWAFVQSKLATAYLQQAAWLPESTSEAIACYEAALRVFSKEQWPERWAALQFALGEAHYQFRIGADGAEHLGLAINCFQQARSVDSAWRAEASNAILAAYLGRSHQALGAYNRESYGKAIPYFHEALKFYRLKTFAGDWADIHFDIAWTYLDMESGSRTLNLRKALEHANLCLKVANLKDNPLAWANDHELLGFIHLSAYQFDPGNLHKAHEEIGLALQVFTRDEYELRWSVNQDYLGRYYYSLQTGQRLENIENAIRCFRRALEVLTPDKYWRGRVRVLEQLVYALLTSAGENGPARVEEAAQAAREGLALVSTERGRPLWGQMQDALGVAFCDLPSPVPGANIATGIALQMLALESYPKEKFPVDHAIVQMHLGNSYVAQAEIALHDEIRELALRNCEEAAKVLSRQRAPRYWAWIQNSMGRACRRRHDTLENALKFHRAALEVASPHAFPQDHAEVCLDMAVTYQHFNATGADHAPELKRCFAAALAYFQENKFTNKCKEIEARMRVLSLAGLPSSGSSTSASASEPSLDPVAGA